MSEIQIKTVADAVNVLEYLISDIDRSVSGRAHIMELGKEHFMSPGQKILNENLALVKALVEGAKAVLERYKSFQNTTAQSYRSVVDKRNQENDYREARYGAGAIVISLAKAYAPRMLEAGMEVPR